MIYISYVSHIYEHIYTGHNIFVTNNVRLQFLNFDEYKMISYNSPDY